MELTINEYKDKIASYIDAAKKSSWITKEEANNLLSQINKDKLTIGVVGQMNVGKSTLINSLVFGDNTLPTSETPMTAALTYISYGDEKNAVAEMLSLADYSEINEKAKQEITEENKTEIESARKLLEKIERISSYFELFGKTINVDFDSFDEYIGADGKFTSLVKLLRLTWNSDNLKGVCIVDTPGYNDPVSSRDLITKNFLSQANVIISVQDVQHHFSKSDVDLIREQIPKSGVGKLIVALNKKDSITSSELEEVMRNAKEHKDEIARKDEDVEQILNSCNIIPVSGVMSLIGQLNEQEINNNSALSFWASEFQFYFPNIERSEFVKFSGLENLQNEISEIVLKQKKDILLKAPCEKLQTLLQAYINKCNIEKEYLEETNEYLSDQQLDFKSILDDLVIFERNIEQYSDITEENCKQATLSKIENTRFSLRDKRDSEIQGITFEEKHSKNYLRYCHNNVEDIYFKLNTIFSDVLRELGNGISETSHDEIADLERKMNLIVFKNSKLIHSVVIKRISKTINESVPRSIGDYKFMETTFPDYWDRQDLYQIGIRSYYRKMVQDSFDNTYINDITAPYKDSSDKIISVIGSGIQKIIDETNKQYASNEPDEIAANITSNTVRIDEFKVLIPKVEQFKEMVSNLIF